MKKYFSLYIIVLCCIFINNINIGSTYCSDYLLNSYKQDLSKCKNYGYCILYNATQLQQIVNKYQKEYDDCVNEEIRTNNYNYRYNKYIDFKSKDNTKEAINALEQAKKYATYGIQGLNNEISYLSNKLGNIYMDKELYSEAIKYYKKSLAIYESPVVLYNIGLAYYYIENYDTSLMYLNKAKQKSEDINLDSDISYRIDRIRTAKEESIAKKNRKTNDEYGYYQYYLPGINIFDARDKLPNNKQKVVIAVIDDGVNLNHPDLKGKIRTNRKEIDGDGIDNDKNGYIDDYNGWDFNLNTKPNLVLEHHGTMVAGIIAANTDNVIGIAGIVPNVEIMSLKVFGFDGETSEEIIIDAINYAIENGANIINLSLGKHQFTYDDKFNPIMKKAYDKGIIVVVAAGNGDLISLNNDGVNTSVTRISPVCNEVNKKAIIGVGALNKRGVQARRSNYGDCVDFFMYGDDITSTSITFDDIPYAFSSGTSFSAPIVAGIVGLGYNKFGKIKPNIVYDNLKKSLSGNVIDAAKYLDNLSISQGELGKAIKWMATNKFTKATNANDFNYNNGITRAEAAKFFVMYAEKFNKNKIVNNDNKCKFSDLDKAPLDLRSYVINACKYGLLAGKNGKFMPNDKLTNAQAVTVFMRMYSGKKDESGNHFADKYFIEATKLGLIDGMIMGKQKNYEKGATRGDMAILLYRGSKLMKK